MEEGTDGGRGEEREGWRNVLISSTWDGEEQMNSAMAGRKRWIKRKEKDLVRNEGGWAYLKGITCIMTA